MRSCTQSFRFWLALFAGLAVLEGIQAQTGADPTRPPGAWMAAQQPHSPGSELATEPASPGAQIVVISPTRKFAMVNGQAVRPGETYNGARLVAIYEDGVAWQRDGVTERTRNSPAVQKKIRGAEPMASAKKSRKTVNGEVQ